MRWQDDDGRWSDEKWKEEDDGWQHHPLMLFVLWLIVPGVILYLIERLFS